MSEAQPAADKNTASAALVPIDTTNIAPVPTAIPSPSSAPTSNIDPTSPAVVVAASAKDDLPTKTSWGEEELELDHYLSVTRDMEEEQRTDRKNASTLLSCNAARLAKNAKNGRHG